MKVCSITESIGIFGGAFDPPHIGHTLACEGLFRDPGLQRLIVMPTGQSRLKNNNLEAEIRFELATLAFSELSQKLPVEVWRTELDLSAKNGTASTTYETLNAIKHQVRNPTVVVGTDQIPTLHRWFRFPEILSLANWIVLNRKSENQNLVDSAQKTLSEFSASGVLIAGSSDKQWLCKSSTESSLMKQVLLIETGAPLISSTWIREQAALTGKIPENVTHTKVAARLKELRAYGT